VFLGKKFDSERAFKDLETLVVEIGSRPSGSDKEKDAAKWIASKFEALGLTTEIDDFEVTTGSVVSQSLKVIEPYLDDVPCEVMPLYGGTGPEGVKGELIYIDSLDEEQLNPIVSGKVILTSGRPKDRKKAYKLLARWKPLALIFIESSPRVLAKNLWGSPIVRERYGEFPTLRISYLDGLKLLESHALKVHLIADVIVTKVKSQNVIGELRGTERPDEIVVIGGHYDTVLEVPGAGDNAGGTAITIELARIFKEKGTKRTMLFVAWGAEELGLLGSRHYSTKLREASEAAKEEDENEDQTELDKTLLCINLDVHGGYIGTNVSNVIGDSDLKSAVKLLSKETGIVFTVNEGVSSTDSTPLSAVGVPSVSFSRNTPPNQFMHSIEDDLKWLSHKALHVQGTFVEEFLTRYVASAAAFPFEKTIPEKQKKDIENYFKRAMRKPP
jgi:hypothetical protein